MTYTLKMGTDKHGREVQTFATYIMPVRTHNKDGKKLQTFDLKATPQTVFDTCPLKNLPDIRGRLIEVKNNNEYIFDIGEGGTLSISEGPSEAVRKVGDVEWLQYNAWNRAAHHRFWSVKFQEMIDDKYHPINFID